MARARFNTQLFALPEPPPARLIVRGCAYRLVKVFKHDFYAATALYEALVPAGRAPVRLVAKFGRTQPFCGVPMDWIGRLLRRREQRVHDRLDGVAGVQRWVALLSPTAYALEFLPGKTLDTLDGPPPAGFFDELGHILQAIHARGAAYCDLHKRSNIVVGPDGRCGLIDFQISVLGPPPGADKPAGSWQRLAEPITRRWVAYLQRMDLYHLYKHKRRLAPAELTAQQEALSHRPGGLAELHRALVTPIRRLRRAFLRRQHRAGRLTSPSAHLETHHQPEKATWRDEDPPAKE